MSHLNFDYVPLTFINEQEEIKKQIRNTLILIHLFEKYNNPVRLEQLIEGTQYGYNASALQSGKNKFLRISDIHESKVNWETVPYCNCDDEKTYLLKKDDILIARTGGTTGKSFKIDNPPAHSIYAGYLIRIRAKQDVIPDYIYLFLHSFAYWSQIVNLNERNFRPKANAENLKSLILPDCPTHIQNDAVKISNGELVKGYEELYSAIENVLTEYDKTQEVQKLLSAQLSQLDNLNQAILQEAVQGKLVSQDPKDEPASELLKRIKAEKAKSGKKEKPLPSIKTEELKFGSSEIPFEIPENWVWCRLIDIISILGDGLHGTPNYDPTGEYYFINGNNLNNGRIEMKDSTKRVSESEYLKHRKPLIHNTVFVSINGTLGNLAYYNGEKIILGKSACYFNLHQDISREYIGNFIKSSYFLKYAVDVASETTIKNVSLKSMRLLPIPFPPLSEQKRIVAEIEKQFAHTKKLKEHIIVNQQATEQLLKALLHQAFEVKETEDTFSK